jgi:hypothetical protein
MLCEKIIITSTVATMNVDFSNTYYSTLLSQTVNKWNSIYFEVLTFWSCGLHLQLATAKYQLLPLFVMDTRKGMPGVPGLFVAGVFSAALRWKLKLFVACYLLHMNIWKLLQALNFCTVLYCSVIPNGFLWIIFYNITWNHFVSNSF